MHALHPAAHQPGTLRREEPDYAHASLPAEAGADQLVLGGMRAHFRRNQEIFGEGEPALSFYGVLRGVVRTCRTLPDGRRQITDFLLPGDIFGFEATPDHRTSAEAVCDCEVATVGRGRLTDRTMEDGAAAQRLWTLALHYLRRSEEHTLVLGRKTAVGRLAWFLIDMSERVPAPERLELMMSRQDIADFLGLTIETVSRTLTRLQDDSVISLASSREVFFKDKRALRELAA